MKKLSLFFRGNLFEIKPQNPYSEADLNWAEENSRVVQEYLNESQWETPLEVVIPENWADYDVILLDILFGGKKLPGLSMILLKKMTF